MAFESGSRLLANASVPQSPPVGEGSEPNQIYVRDALGGTTALLSDANGGQAFGPTISADGRLVGYELADNRVNSGGLDSIVVVDRKATGGGALDGPGNLRVSQVTGGAQDLPFEQIPPCPASPQAPVRACGPRLSADGTTLVYPAEQTPVSQILPAVLSYAFPPPTTGPIGAAPPGNLVDFTAFFNDGYGSAGSTSITVSYQAAGTGSVTVGAAALSATPPFTIADTSCPVSVLTPGRSCDVTVTSPDTSLCPSPAQQVPVTGTLSMSPSGAGSSRLALAGFACAPAAGLAGASCPAVPAGTPVEQAPGLTEDNQGANLADLGGVDRGRPRIAYLTFSPNPRVDAGGFIEFSAGSACGGVQLVVPGVTPGVPAADAVPGRAAPCQNGEQFTPGASPVATGFAFASSCTAYFLIAPQAVSTDAAFFGMVGALDFNDVIYLTVSGVDDVVVARHDPSGSGRFADSPTTVVSVDGSGVVLPGAGEPTVSATGRYVAFSAPIPFGQPGQQPVDGNNEVWLHDSDRAGDRTYRPGPSILVSCLPGPAPCAPVANAGSPSLSGDGNTVAFATSPTAPSPPPTGTPSADQTSANQVDVREVAAGSTIVASAGPGAAAAGGNGPSYSPALSEDGSTIAYVSGATDLAAPPLGPPAAADVFVRQLSPPGSANEPILGASTTVPGAVADAPAIDAHGRLVAFQSATQLTSRPTTPGVANIYMLERFPALRVLPAAVDFGTVPLGLTPIALTVDLGDSGPGPASVAAVTITGPFALGPDTCLGTVVHAGAHCMVVIDFRPDAPGPSRGGLVITTADDGEAPLSLVLPITAAVTAPAARMVVEPAVDQPGQVVRVRGTGFPAATVITLSWNPGLGTATAHTGSGGDFTAELAIFPDDLVGIRLLVARDPGGRIVATLPFLVETPPKEPPFTRGPGT